MSVVAGIVGGLVGSLVEALKSRKTGDQPPFAELLASRLSAADRAREAEIDRVAANLRNLPLTSDQVREIAQKLVALADGLKAKCAAGSAVDPEMATYRFVSGVLNEFALSQKDAAGLERTAKSYVKGQLPIRLPA